ncbi:family 43 glycosylhydrolase, partial [Listeria valentina]|uniref:family 43 glycosylhydrolase n=1 Tax=Listeria valentina TaxID=2705293 RepID=UPI00143175CD
LYIYGSLDNSGDTEFCSTKYFTYSTTDLVKWQNHGVIFDSMDPSFGLKSKLTLGAPDCLFIDDKYYLYYCSYGNRMGVAVSESPAGPFKHIGAVEPADGDSIDPAIFQDEDGSAYYFWGQFNLRGGKLAKDKKTILPETIQYSLLNEHEHGFHEGASIRKLNGIYYMVYTDISRGKATCLAYATAEHPLGPYKKQGIIIDNIGCDSQCWNNHGSIELYQNQLYVFYHRSSQGSMYNRRLCIEKIYLDKDNKIKEVPMSSNGVSPCISTDEKIPVSRLSKMKVKTPFDHLEPMSLQPSVSDEQEVLVYTKENDWIQFDNVDFGKGKYLIDIEVATIKPMKVEIWIGGNEKIGEIEVEAGNSWSKYNWFSKKIQPISGVNNVWLLFKSKDYSVGRLGNIKSIYFR